MTTDLDVTSTRCTTRELSLQRRTASNELRCLPLLRYVNAVLDSELSGNVVDLCPVGALTSKPNAFAARSWEYRTTASIDVLDGCGPSIQIDTAKGEVMRIQPRTNDEVN